MVGSISLLVSSIIGPGMVLIPLVFQESGWVVPITIFAIVGILGGLASLFVVEAVSRFPGNEKFNRNVEFTVMVHQFYGRKVYYIFLAILYGSLQSTNLASIIGSAQILDSIFVGILGGTCGYGIYPINGLYCVTQVTNHNSPFGDNYMLATFGYLMVAAIIIPMTSIELNDNMFVQFVSFMYNLLFLITLVATTITKGIVVDKVPTIGNNHSQVIGQVLFNFTLANTIPSWLNVKHEKVDPKKAVWYSIGVSLLMYIATGYLGAVTYSFGADTNLLQAMFADQSMTRAGTIWITIIYIVFPILTYMTSIPVAMIVTRLNFMAARILSLEGANFWSVYVPFIIGIPFQTGAGITIIGTYTSLSFQSLCNFFAPFLIYLMLSKRKMEMAQSVLDEVFLIHLA
jgi:amino acid permease